MMNQMLQWMRQMSRLGSQGVSSVRDQTTPQQVSFARQIQRDLKEMQPLQTPLQELPITVIDLETTGFYPDKGDEILSVGAVKVRGGEVQIDETYYSLVYYKGDISSTITELTGIRKEDVADAPPLSQVLVELYQFLNTDVLVAHHSRHEKQFLQHYVYQVLGTNFQHRLLDTTFLLRILKPDLRSQTLEECCDNYGIEVINRHHALGDAIVTAELWTKMVKEVMALGFTTLQDVYVQLNSHASQ